jgi:hypothetical protein
VQVLNCYIQPGEQQELKDRARRIVDITKDIVKLAKSNTKINEFFPSVSGR